MHRYSVSSFRSTRGRIQLYSGIIEAWGPLFRAFRAVPWLRDTVAITLGHVVLGRDEEWIIWSRSHERVHVRQYEVWGILFFPAYLLSSFRVLLIGGTRIWKTGLSVLPEQMLHWPLWLTSARRAMFNAAACAVRYAVLRCDPGNLHITDIETGKLQVVCFRHGKKYGVICRLSVSEHLPHLFFQ
uniref:Uncharacterized protein n=1 Tax=Chlorobium phaeobacteroides (strain BS1) TaxID=331678 RepID=B3EJM2_CHLPB